MNTYKEIVKALGSDPSLANAVMNAIQMRSSGAPSQIKFNCDVDDMQYIMLGDNFLVDKKAFEMINPTVNKILEEIKERKLHY